MIRRHPVTAFLSGLMALGAVYFLLAHKATALVNELWFDHVECRMVEDRAQLKPLGGRRLFGLYRPELPWEYSRYYPVTDSLQVDPQIVSWYQSWGDGKEQEFKTEAVEKVLEKGLTPMITWEPWTTSFAGHENDTGASLGHIVAGEFDPYLRRWARSVARVHKPVFLRPFHEMGNAWYLWGVPHGNTPEMLAEGWRHVVRIFREEGARNAAFVWTPHIAADTMAWPGDEWVDWIGLDVFNYGTMAVKGTWMDFNGLLIPQLNAVRRFRKPVMLAELGTSAAGGDRRDWWIDAFRRLPEHPDVRAVVVFDNPACSNTTGIPVDWGFSQTPGILAALRPLGAAAGFQLPAAAP